MSKKTDTNDKAVADVVQLNQYEKELVSRNFAAINQHQAAVRQLQATVQEYLSIALTRVGKNPTDYALDTRNMTLVLRKNLGPIKAKE